jgi:hypothetical protein
MVNFQGFPLNIPALVTTDEAQTRNIVSHEFARRSMEELGYLPFRNLTPVSSTDAAFDIEIDLLQADSSDPLDPQLRLFDSNTGNNDLIGSCHVPTKHLRDDAEETEWGLNSRTRIRDSRRRAPMCARSADLQSI